MKHMFDGKSVCRLAWFSGSPGQQPHAHALRAGYGMLVKFGFRNGKAFIQKRCTPDLAACQPSFNTASAMNSGIKKLKQHLPAMSYADIHLLACRFVQSEAFKYFQQHGHVKYTEFATGPPTLRSLATVLGGKLGEQPGLSKADPFARTMPSQLALLHLKVDCTKASALCR